MRAEREGPGCRGGGQVRKLLETVEKHEGASATPTQGALPRYFAGVSYSLAFHRGTRSREPVWWWKFRFFQDGGGREQSFCAFPSFDQGGNYFSVAPTVLVVNCLPISNLSAATCFPDSPFYHKPSPLLLRFSLIPFGNPRRSVGWKQPIIAS